MCLGLALVHPGSSVGSHFAFPSSTGTGGGGAPNLRGWLAGSGVENRTRTDFDKEIRPPHKPPPPYPSQMSQDTSECSSQEVADPTRSSKRQKKDTDVGDKAVSLASALRAAKASDLKRAAKELGDCYPSKVLMEALAKEVASGDQANELVDTDLVQVVQSSISKTSSASGQKRLRTEVDVGNIRAAQIPYQLRAALNRKLQLCAGNSCVDYDSDWSCCADGVYQFQMGLPDHPADWLEECYLAVLEQISERECIPNREDAGLDEDEDVDLFDVFGVTGSDPLLEDAYHWRMANEDPAALLEQFYEELETFLHGQGWRDQRDFSKYTEDLRVDATREWVRKPKVRLVIDDGLVC